MLWIGRRQNNVDRPVRGQLLSPRWEISMAWTRIIAKKMERNGKTLDIFNKTRLATRRRELSDDSQVFSMNNNPYWQKESLRLNYYYLYQV